MSFFKRLFLGDSVSTVGKASFKSLKATEPTEEDELQGLWIFNDTISDISSLSFYGSTISLNTQVNGATFNQMYFGGDTARIEFGVDGSFKGNYLWKSTYGVYTQRRYIKITDTLSEMLANNPTYGQDFLTWLKANATKYVSQATTTELQFSAYDTYKETTETATFLQGMVWFEFINSEYNTIGTKLSFYGLAGGREYDTAYYELNEVTQTATDTIQAVTYSWSSYYSGGGTND